jgi:hypothetical protein
MRLSLFLIGPFQAIVDQDAIAASRAKKIEALLAYLAVESDHAHRRENLVGLFFPEMGEALLLQSVEVLRSYDNSVALALSLGFLAVATYSQGDYALALQLGLEGHDIAKATGDRYSMAVANNVLSQINYLKGKLIAARKYSEQSLRSEILPIHTPFC